MYVSTSVLFYDEFLQQSHKGYLPDNEKIGIRDMIELLKTGQATWIGKEWNPTSRWETVGVHRRATAQWMPERSIGEHG